MLDGLRELAGRHELVGDVRGRGLFLGVELVTDRETREPATAARQPSSRPRRPAACSCPPTGRDDNVLKIKPPLVLAEADVDRAVEVLDAALDG